MTVSASDSATVANPAAASDLPTLSHYQIRAQLGEGGFGDVYEAWDSKLRRSVAIKRMKHVPNAPTSLLKEARLAASLQHAAFVKIFAIEEDGDSTAIVMELVPGITLRVWGHGQPQEVAQVLELIRQVADAMQEAHAAGLTHGDLKPSNLILEPGGKLRILDFGLATQTDSQATASVSQLDPQGTIAYMAPELMLGTLANAKSDIYALGVICYELLNGSRPHAHLSGLALAAAHMQASSDGWDYPANLPTPVIQLIRSMTASKPELRLSSMAAVVEQIKAISQRISDNPHSASIPAHVSNPFATTLNAAAGNPVSVTLSAPLSIAGLAATTSAPAAATKQPLSQPLRWGIATFSLTLLTGLLVWQIVPRLSPAVSSAMTNTGNPAAVITSPAGPYSEALEMQQGLAALKLFDRPGSLDAADKNFNTILSHNPNNAAAAAGLSLLYSFRYRSDEQDEVWLQKADASAQQALKLNGQLALSHVAKGLVLDLQGKAELGLAEQEKALSLDPKNFFAWNEKTNALRSLRRYADAKKNAELARQHFPQERIFADQLGSIHYAQDDYKAAEAAFKLSIQLQPDAVFSYANLSGALMSQNRNDEALEVLQQGLQLRPSAMLYGNLGNAQFLRGDYVAAAAAFELAVSPDKGNPADYLGWANLADTLLWIPGRKEEARKAYDKAKLLLAPKLARSQNDATLTSRMGLYAARTGDKSKGLELLQKSVNLAPEDAAVLFYAGLGYELLGNRAEALEAIAKAKKFGYPISFIENEPDLLALRRDARYSRP
ncbi:protein kinase domain-containing protein [Undibacterium parvum]|uniref:Protein kinase n=2 Tax=Undibacterium TaxID=401469 RepID=A0A6M4A5U5_9BURK|nr:serine/threonine-protein kinase [Undibacterium parvum]AZP11629.1 serine/threonine-protein kinase [Undibacterium parvum]QJQ06080.1 protein kinase [Undibacterium piscinae]